MGDEGWGGEKRRRGDKDMVIPLFAFHVISAGNSRDALRLHISFYLLFVPKTMVEAPPTTINRFPSQVTPCSLLLLTFGCDQVMLSREVTTTPKPPLNLPPTATRNSPLHARSKRCCLVPEDLVVHLIPSGELTMHPSHPTATNCRPSQITSSR